MSETLNADPFGFETEYHDSEKDFLIVGIGASAGGIQALKTFFKRVPADSVWPMS